VIPNDTCKNITIRVKKYDRGIVRRLNVSFEKISQPKKEEKH